MHTTLASRRKSKDNLVVQTTAPLLGYLILILASTDVVRAGTPTRQSAPPAEHVFAACTERPTPTEASTPDSCNCKVEPSPHAAYTPMLDKLADDDLIRKLLVPKIVPELDEQIAARRKLLGCLNSSSATSDCKTRISTMRRLLEKKVAGFRLALALSKPPKTLADSSIDPNIEMPLLLRPNTLSPLTEHELMLARRIQGRTALWAQSGEQILGGHKIQPFRSANPKINALTVSAFVQACHKGAYPDECRRYEAYGQNINLDLRQSARSAVARMLVENPMISRFDTVPITDKKLIAELSATAANLQGYRDKIRSMDPAELIMRYPDQWNNALKGHPELCARLERRFIAERSKMDAKSWAQTLLKVSVLVGTVVLPLGDLVPLATAAIYAGLETGQAAATLTEQQEIYSSLLTPSPLLSLRNVQEAHTDFILSVANLPIAAAAAAGAHTLFEIAGKAAWGDKAEAAAIDLETAIANGSNSLIKAVSKETVKTSIDESTSNALSSTTQQAVKNGLSDGILPGDAYVYNSVLSL